MKISASFGSALQIIGKGMEGLERNAARVASAAGEGGQTLHQPLVESKLDRLQVEAGVRMLRTVDETIGTLFDDKA